MPTPSAEWIAWAVGIAIGFPLVMIVFGEVILRLEREGRALEGPLRAVRSVVLPLLALRLILSQILSASPASVGVKAVTTVAVIAMIWVALLFVNAVVFGEAEAGSWRARVPKLLRDLVLLGLVLMGAALVLSEVWEIPLGGLVTALGLGSIVIGLALQDTLGSIMSGIALLSERPFSEGDWIHVDGVEGRVVEMNWRAVRLQTRTGDVVIVPHLVIAKEIVRNYTRVAGHHADHLTLGFGYEHPPNVVKNVLVATARETPGVLLVPAPNARTVGYGDSAVDYELWYWIDDMTARPQIRERLMTRIWYAAQRNGLSIPFPIRTLVHTTPEPDATDDEARRQLESVPFLDAAAMGDTTVLYFGGGEIVLREGEVSDGLYVIVSGTARLSVRDVLGRDREVETLDPGALFGVSTLFTSAPNPATVTAQTDLAVLSLRADAADRLLAAQPVLVEEIGHLTQDRREAIQSARLGGAGDGA